MKLTEVIKNEPAHRILFYVFLLLLPIQTRILYRPTQAYIDWSFNYHLSLFFYLTDLVLLACFITWTVFDRPDPVKLLGNVVFRLILGFFGLILVTLFHVKHLSLGWYGTLKWLEMLGIIMYISATFTKREFFHVSLFMVFLASIFQAGLAWAQFHVQHSVGLDWLGEYIAPFGTAGLATIETITGKIIRAYGTMPHPNVLGAFLVLGLISSLFLLRNTFHASRLTTFAVSCGTILILIATFLTFSRLAWLGSAVALISFTFCYWKQRIRTLAALIILISVVSCATILTFYRQDLKSRVVDTNTVSISDRNFFNSIGIDLVNHYPVLGVGVGNYVEALKDLYRLEPWQNQPAHNIFIFIAAELGILGTILFIIILFEIFSRLKNVQWDDLSFSLVLIGVLFLCMSQFDHYFVTIQQGRLMFATVLGLIAALPNIKDVVS